MKIAELKVSGTHCEVKRLEPIPRGIVGGTVSINYADSKWESLRKTVVFRGVVTKDVLDAGNEVTIPAEVLSRAGVRVYMGVYGVDAEDTIVIPTVWAELGITQNSTAPAGDTSTNPTLPVWAQIQETVGDLSKLETSDKSSLVAAINEGLAKDGGTVDPTIIQEIVDDYLAANPPHGEKWEKIAEIIIPDDAEESNALTINKDLNGQPFALLKARLCSKFPKYTGESAIPGYSFAMLNGKTAGNPSPAAYTTQWPKVSSSVATGSVYEVDVSGVQTVESVLRSSKTAWILDSDTYGNSSSSYVKYFTDSLWAKPITSIGGTGMLIYPGCKFVLYGVRA